MHEPGLHLVHFSKVHERGHLSKTPQNLGIESMVYKCHFTFLVFMPFVVARVATRRMQVVQVDVGLGGLSGL